MPPLGPIEGESYIVLNNRGVELTLTRDLVACLLDLPSADAAEALGLGSTSMKRLRAWLGVERWPHRWLLSNRLPMPVRKLCLKGIPRNLRPEQKTLLAITTTRSVVMSAVPGPGWAIRDVMCRAQKRAAELGHDMLDEHLIEQEEFLRLVDKLFEDSLEEPPPPQNFKRYRRTPEPIGRIMRSATQGARQLRDVTVESIDDVTMQSVDDVAGESIDDLPAPSFAETLCAS